MYWWEKIKVIWTKQNEAKWAYVNLAIVALEPPLQQIASFCFLRFKTDHLRNTEPHKSLPSEMKWWYQLNKCPYLWLHEIGSHLPHVSEMIRISLRATDIIRVMFIMCRHTGTNGSTGTKPLYIKLSIYTIYGWDRRSPKGHHIYGIKINWRQRRL